MQYNGRNKDNFSINLQGLFMQRTRKKEIKLKDSQKLLEYEKELREKYNTDNLFKNKKNKDVEYEFKDETSMMIVQEEKWYKKIFNIIKNLFKRNS